MKSNLQEILSSILCDIVLAQHRANMYSQEIAKEYETRTGTALKKIPHVKFSDIELDLRFVADGVVQEETGEKVRVGDLETDNPYPSLVIDIDTSTLASMPAESIQSLKIKVQPRTIEKGNE